MIPKLNVPPDVPAPAPAEICPVGFSSTLILIIFEFLFFPSRTSEETDLNNLEGSKISKSVEVHLSHYFRSLGDSLPAPGLYQTVLKEVEVPLINLTLALCDGNQIKASNLLGINRNTLRKKIKDYDLVVTRGKKLM